MYRPQAQTFIAKGICMSSTEDTWAVGSANGKEAIIKFQKTESYRATFARNFIENTHTSAETAFTGCRTEGSYLAAIGFEHRTVLFLDMANNSLKFAQETNANGHDFKKSSTTEPFYWNFD